MEWDYKKNLEKIFDIKISDKNINLFKTALTHTSASQNVDENYERLEFLGDAVLK